MMIPRNRGSAAIVGGRWNARIGPAAAILAPLRRETPLDTSSAISAPVARLAQSRSEREEGVA
jgi:RES domain-containing protein